jgi:hypothetical protein
VLDAQRLGIIQPLFCIPDRKDGIGQHSSNHIHFDTLMGDGRQFTSEPQ